jgi:hypothetical protein
MPISINEYANPRWVKIRPRYPWVTEKNYAYRNLTINPRTPVGRYNADATRGDGWKAQGYNPNHNSVKTEVVRTNTDTTARGFKPY